MDSESTLAEVGLASIAAPVLISQVLPLLSFFSYCCCSHLPPLLPASFSAGAFEVLVLRLLLRMLTLLRLPAIATYYFRVTAIARANALAMRRSLPLPLSISSLVRCLT